MCRCAGSREMRRSLVKRYSYHEQDYAFGQLMLTLRMQIGLTQGGLAERLHVHRRAVAGWEAGSSYPKADHLKELITLGVEQQAFAAGGASGHGRHRKVYAGLLPGEPPGSAVRGGALALGARRPRMLGAGRRLHHLLL